MGTNALASKLKSEAIVSTRDVKECKTVVQGSRVRSKANRNLYFRMSPPLTLNGTDLKDVVNELHIVLLKRLS